MVVDVVGQRGAAARVLRSAPEQPVHSEERLAEDEA